MSALAQQVVNSVHGVALSQMKTDSSRKRIIIAGRVIISGFGHTEHRSGNQSGLRRHKTEAGRVRGGQAGLIVEAGQFI